MLTSGQVLDLLKVHGTCRSQPPSLWTGDLPLPDAVADFYRDIGPVDLTIEGHGNPTFMPSLPNLWRQQAGYRWNGLTGDPIANWNPDWFVVAFEGGNPYIYFEGKVLFALCGAGVWEPREVFANLNTMAACLSILGIIVLNAGEGFADQDSIIRPQFIDEAISRLTEIVGSRNHARTILTTTAWC